MTMININFTHSGDLELDLADIQVTHNQLIELPVLKGIAFNYGEYDELEKIVRAYLSGIGLFEQVDTPFVLKATIDFEGDKYVSSHVVSNSNTQFMYAARIVLDLMKIIYREEEQKARHQFEIEMKSNGV